MRRNVYGDGNCLFRAVCVGLFGTETRYAELRQVAVEYIRSNRALFADYFLSTGTFANTQEHMDVELNNLSQNGVYAGYECILALSMVYRRNIYITQGGSTGNRVSTIVLDESNQYDSLDHIHLIYSTSIGGGHYDLAVEDNTGSNFPYDSFPKLRTDTVHLRDDTHKSASDTVHLRADTDNTRSDTVHWRTDTSGSDTVHLRTDTSGSDTVHLPTHTSGSDTVHLWTDTSGSDTVHWRTDTSGSDTVRLPTETSDPTLFV